MTLTVKAVRYNDLHDVRDDCHGKCEQVVTLSYHAEKLKDLNSKLDQTSLDLVEAVKSCNEARRERDEWQLQAEKEAIRRREAESNYANATQDCARYLEDRDIARGKQIEAERKLAGKT